MFENHESSRNRPVFSSVHSLFLFVVGIHWKIGLAYGIGFLSVWMFSWTFWFSELGDCFMCVFSASKLYSCICFHNIPVFFVHVRFFLRNYRYFVLGLFTSIWHNCGVESNVGSPSMFIAAPCYILCWDSYTKL